MKKKIILSTMLLCMIMTLTSCSDSTLQKENEELKAKIETLEAQLEEKEKETTVKEDDVTVILSGKTSEQEGNGINYYVAFIFNVTNNTDKPIKGIKGTAIVSDMFGSEILNIGCNFTGKTINSGETANFEDLTYNVNQYDTNDSKLYTTELKDLKFEYKIQTIIFEDGTSKDISE